MAPSWKLGLQVVDGSDGEQQKANGKRQRQKATAKGNGKRRRRGLLGRGVAEREAGGLVEPLRHLRGVGVGEGSVSALVGCGGHRLAERCIFAVAEDGFAETFDVLLGEDEAGVGDDLGYRAGV